MSSDMSTLSYVRYLEEPYAAGILPIAFHEGKVYFLIGDDIRGTGYADFGGKAERKVDRSISLVTASREFYEETLGLSIGYNEIRARLEPTTSILVEGRTQNGNVYHMFITEVPWDPHLPRNVKRSTNYLRSRGVGRIHVEKKSVQWVTLEELIKIHKRAVFESTLLQNSRIIYQIGRCPPEKWAELCLAYAKKPELFTTHAPQK
jgi:hypothetical protein